MAARKAALPITCVNTGTYSEEGQQSFVLPIEEGPTLTVEFTLHVAVRTFVTAYRGTESLRRWRAGSDSAGYEMMTVSRRGDQGRPAQAKQRSWS
jgi:hypothetical protein